MGTLLFITNNCGEERKLFGFFIIRYFYGQYWCTPKLFNRLKCKSEVKTTEEQKVGDMLLGS